MFIFSEEKGRTYKRDRAIGLKELVIENDVTIGSNITVEISNDNKAIVIRKDTSGLEEASKSIHILTDEFGVFNDIENEIEFILLDNAMFIELRRGAILIKNPQTDEPMMIHRDVDEEKIKSVNLAKVKWVNEELVEGFLSYSNKYGKDYTLDYMSVAICKSNDSESISFKHIESTDISCGGFVIRDKKEAARLARMAFKSVIEQNEEDEEDDYEEEGTLQEDEEDDYDEYDEDDDYFD